LLLLSLSAYGMRTLNVFNMSRQMINIAGGLADEGNFRGAIDVLASFLESHPGNAEVWLYQCELWDRLHKSQSFMSRDLLNRAIDRQKKAIPFLEGDSQKEVRERVLGMELEIAKSEPGTWPALISSAREIVQLWPKHPLATKVLAMGVYRQFAMTGLRPSSEDLPLDQLLQAAWELNPGDIDLAKDYATFLRSIRPDWQHLLSPERLLNDASARNSEADSIIDSMVQANPENANAYLTRYEYQFVNQKLEISFPFPGVPVDLKIINGKYNFAFRKIFDGNLFRLTYNNSGRLLEQQAIEISGIDFPIFRAAAVSDGNLYWVIYDNRFRKNYLLNIDVTRGDTSQKLELPTFYPPAGHTYEMEPPVFFAGDGKGGFHLIAGALYAKIRKEKIEERRLTDCETVIEAKFTSKNIAVLCRALKGRKGTYFLDILEENNPQYLDMANGIPWHLEYAEESGRFSVRQAKSQKEILDLFLWDLSHNQQSGMLEFGVNNTEGRIPWSQIYYLNGLMDLLLLVDLHQDAHSIFGSLSDEVVRRIILEIKSLDDLLETDLGFYTKGFTYDRSPALFAVQTSRLLLLFDRYTEELPDAPHLKNAEKLRKLLTELDGHIEELAYDGEKASWMRKGTAHLRWPKCSAFYFDGMAVPFNHQNEWAYSLFNAARVRGVSANTPSLDAQRAIIGFFMERLGNKGGFPSTDKWYYWYGHAFDGWIKEDAFSCNTPTYPGDHGLAYISFRTIDFMSVMSALDFMNGNNLDRKKLLESGFDAVKHGDVYPFAARSLLAFQKVPQIQISILEQYYRATAPWELSNTPWALVLGASTEKKQRTISQPGIN